MGKFINISNHKSSDWCKSQLDAAKYYGDIIDVPFPQINPEMTTLEISNLAMKYVKKIEEYGIVTVMVQGEFTFTYALIKRLRNKGINVVAACTTRIAEEQVLPNGTVVKNSIFDFSGFRRYE